MSYWKDNAYFAFNVETDTCVGGLPIFDCPTVKEINKNLVIEVPPDQSIPDAWCGGSKTPELVCSDCEQRCGAAYRVVEGRFTEEVVYVFTDANELRAYDGSGIVESEG